MFRFSLALLTSIIMLGWCTDLPVISSPRVLCHGDDMDEPWISNLIASGILEARHRRRKMKPRSKDMAVINEGSERKTE